RLEDVHREGGAELARIDHVLLARVGRLLARAEKGRGTAQRRHQQQSRKQSPHCYSPKKCGCLIIRHRRGAARVSHFSSLPRGPLIYGEVQSGGAVTSTVHNSVRCGRTAMNRMRLAIGVATLLAFAAATAAQDNTDPAVKPGEKRFTFALDNAPCA